MVSSRTAHSPIAPRSSRPTLGDAPGAQSAQPKPCDAPAAQPPSRRAGEPRLGSHGPVPRDLLDAVSEVFAQLSAPSASTESRTVSLIGAGVIGLATAGRAASTFRPPSAMPNATLVPADG